MAEHALEFRVMRLSAPTLQLDPPLRFEARDLVPDSAAASQQRAGREPHPFAARVDAAAAAEAAGSGGGLAPLLSLPQSFGAVYLGQCFAAYITVCNYSEWALAGVGVRVELQTERGAKASLLDTTPSPLASLAPGQRLEFLVKHDIKELGAHTLTCSSVYATPDGERRFLPQVFRFAATNPLVVRTKHRMVREAFLLEATLENATRAPMLLEAVQFLPSQQYAAASVAGAPAATAEGEGSAPAGPLSSYIASTPLLPPEGGAQSYVFRLTPKGSAPGSGGSSPSTSSGGAGGATPLGKMEIRWRGPLGDAARLQTQLISLPAQPAKEAVLSIVRLPQKVRLEQPFEATVRIQSRVDRRLGPLRISAAPAPSAAGQGAAAAAGGGGGGHNATAVVLEGAEGVLLEELAPQAAAEVKLQLLPLAAGQQAVAGLLLSSERDGTLFDQLAPTELFVGC